MWNSFENRNFVRIKKECGISVKTPDKSEVFHSVTENLGIGGLCANLSQPLEPFSEVYIKLILKPDMEPFECKARVAWSIKHHDFNPKLVHYDVGFEFLEISAEKRLILEKFLSEITNGS